MTFFENKKVLITGNTGFIGTWLSLFLHYCGAHVIGYAKGNGNHNEFSKLVNAHINIKQHYGDITNKQLLEEVIIQSNPDIIFHFAGQALIDESYINPFETIYTNVHGTLCLLDIINRHNYPCKLVVMTGDKCYKLKEGKQVYMESDEIGGADPYSISKAMQEQLVSMYYKNFFSNSLSLVKCSTIRSGNIIGGGDFSSSRLIPCIIKSIDNKEDIILREPNARKSWTHIYDAISSYLLIAENISGNENISGQSFNVGPDNKPEYTTLEIVRFFLNAYEAPINIIIEQNKRNRSNLPEIYLSNKKIRQMLAWQCKVPIESAIKNTTEWFKVFHQNKDEIVNFSLQEIKKYMELNEN